MKSKLFRLVLLSLAAGVLYLDSGQASAETIADFTLDNVTFSDGGTATGSFTLDFTLGLITSANIVTSTDEIVGPIAFGDTYGSVGSSFSNNPASFSFLGGIGVQFTIDLATGLTAADLVGPTSFTISGGGESIFSGDFGRGITGGSLDIGDVTVTPLPAALPLFAGGLGMVGLLSRRKKRKADQDLAAA
jgi:hypothetical protein